jgi:hypothetical protein
MDTILSTILRLTYFRAPLLRTLLPTVALAYTLQTGIAIPSIVLQTERLYDLSGSFTYIACTAFSFFLPYLRARAMNKASGIPWNLSFSDYWGAPAPGQEWWWWRQVVLSACVAVWAGRGKCIPSCFPSFYYKFPVYFRFYSTPVFDGMGW